MKSKIEQWILDPAFDYLQPYFYQNPFALRCELGVGDDAEDYLRAAHARAEAIYRILFPRGADAVIFNQWIYDWSDSGAAESAMWSDAAAEVTRRVEEERRALRFLLEMQMKYRHVAVKNLKTYLEPDDPDFANVRRNRIVCFRDGAGFDDLALLRGQIDSEQNQDVSLVSFEHECILSVYDDRGCDVVFADAAHLRAQYDALRPYFLAYDLEEMEKRKEQSDGI